MGLAPYGDTGSPNIEIKNDGSLWLNHDYFYFNIRILTKNGIHFIFSISLYAKIIFVFKVLYANFKRNYILMSAIKNYMLFI